MLFLFSFLKSWIKIKSSYWHWHIISRRVLSWVYFHVVFYVKNVFGGVDKNTNGFKKIFYVSEGGWFFDKLVVFGKRVDDSYSWVTGWKGQKKKITQYREKLMGLFIWLSLFAFFLLFCLLINWA